MVRPATWRFAHAVALHEQNVKTQEELKRISHNRRSTTDD